MLGCNAAYVINVSHRGDLEWHKFCARYWMHLTHTDPLDGVSWGQRLVTVVWMALTALALGQDVLVHCQAGKHRSGAVVMLLMTVLAVGGLEDWAVRPIVVREGLTRV